MKLRSNVKIVLFTLVFVLFSIMSVQAVTLEVMDSVIVESPEREALLQIIENFEEENPDITIDYQGVPMNDAYAQIPTLATSGALPDVYLATLDFIGTFEDMGIATDLRDVFSQEYLDGFNQNSLSELTVDGKVLAHPFFVIPMGVLYRIDWFEEKGLTPPETWEEFLDIANELTEDTNGDGSVDRWGFAMLASRDGSGGSRFIQIFRTFGGYELRLNDEGEYVTDVNTPQGRNAFEFFTELNTEHEVVPPGPMEVSYGEALNLMATNKTAMMVTGPHSIGGIIERNPELDGKIGAFPLPMAQDGGKHISVLNTYGHAINPDSDKKEEAAKFLKFLVNDESALLWNEMTGRMPTRTGLLQSPEVQDRPDLAGFVEAMDYAEPLPTVSYYSTIMTDILPSAYQSIIVGQATVEEAAERAEERIISLIEEN